MAQEELDEKEILALIGPSVHASNQSFQDTELSDSTDSVAVDQ
jgi:hypothetical protein